MAQKQEINTSYFNSLVRDYKAKLTDANGVADIVTFSEAAWGMNFKLFPMQRFILKMFYGLELSDAEKTIPLPDELNTKTIGWFTEKEMLEYLIETKRVNITEYVPGRTKRELMLCCGRRASKSNIISLVCAYEAYRMLKLGNPQEYFGFPSGQEIDITAVASVDDQASTIFNMVKNRVVDSGYFRGRISGDTQSYFSLLTDEDLRVGRDASVRIYCGGAGSSSLRSKNNIVVVMDEAAHFAQYGRSSLPACWQALTPSVASFVPKGKSQGEGKIIMLSSPLSKSGMFWDKYCESFDFPDEMLMFQMYTSMVNIRVDSTMLKTEQRRNKELFRCEYGGEFSDTVEGWVSPEVLSSCVDEAVSSNRMKGVANVQYYMGIDFGGKNDGTSVAICHKEDDTIILDYADVYYSSGSDVWDGIVPYYADVNRLFAEDDIISMNGVADEVKRLCDRFNVVYGWFDQFNGYGLLELLNDRGLPQFETRNVSSSLNTQVYQTVKSLMGGNLLRMFNHPVLIPELASLEERKSGNTVKVEAPQRSGFHDDISDAFARSVFAAYNESKGKKEAVTLGLGGKQTLASSYRTFKYERFKMHGDNSRSLPSM